MLIDEYKCPEKTDKTYASSFSLLQYQTNYSEQKTVELLQGNSVIEHFHNNLDFILAVK